MIKSFYNNFSKFLTKPVSIAPLISFRIVFGLVLLYSSIRTLQKDWIFELFIKPEYHFSFIDFITPLSEKGMYNIFYILILCSLAIILGLFYRIATITFFLLFTYCELIDKTFYLNHYYLVSLLTFWLAIVPANRYYSLDAKLFPKIKSFQCFNWHILIFKVQLSIVYFFAGLAKVNADWLFRGQPLASWLPGRYDIPILGKILHLKSVALIFSWVGCLYDLFIWIFLLLKRTRNIAYVLVIVFHILTGILFPRIGMFPYIMVCSTIIFFSPEWHQKALSFLPFYNNSFKVYSNEHKLVKNSFFLVLFLSSYLLIQLYLPLRFLQYPGNLFWHERGYRFSWRVMLMEKNGETSIVIKDPKTGKKKEIEQNEYLTRFQRQQMRTQPDMILQFCKHIGDEFKIKNGYNPEIYVKSRISLNGKRSKPFTNYAIDVYNTESNILKTKWILPYHQKNIN